MWFDTLYSGLVDDATAIGRRMVEYVKGHVDALERETDWGVVRGQTLEALGLMLGVAGLVPVDWGGSGGATRCDRCGDSSLAAR